MFFEETLGFLQLLGKSTQTHMNSNRSSWSFPIQICKIWGIPYRMPDSRIDPMLAGPQNISTQQNGLFSLSYSCDPYSATNILTKCWHILRHSAISSDSFWHMYNIFGTLLWQFLSEYISSIWLINMLLFVSMTFIYIYTVSISLTVLLTYILTVAAMSIQTAVPRWHPSTWSWAPKVRQPPDFGGVDGCGREPQRDSKAHHSIRQKIYIYILDLQSFTTS
jgi:hypothetical protein